MRWQVTVAVMVSPILTGCEKRIDWSMKIVPGPGRRLLSTVAINTPGHMPWTITSPKEKVLA